MNPAASRQAGPRWLPMGAAYLVVTLLIAAPLLPQFGTAILGGPIAASDGFFHVWHVWWVQQALSNGQTPFFTPLLFHPFGIALYLQPITLSNGLLVLPVTALWGAVAGFNLAALLSVLLSGLAGYALSLRVSGSQWGAFLGGFVFALAPFHLTRMWDGQLELMAVQWLGFYSLFALRAVEALRWRDALIAGVLLAVIGYTAWYYLLFTLVFSAAFALLWLRRPWLSYLRQWATIGLLAALLLAPAALPGLLSLLASERDLAPVDRAEVVAYSANLLDFWLPSYLHPLWGAAVKQTIEQRWHFLSGDWNVALGYGVIVLATLGCLSAWRTAWRWLALTALSLIFALGPVLQVGPWQSTLPLPYALLTMLPGADFGRRPLHFTALATLSLAPLVALGAQALLTRVAAPRQGLVGALVLLLLTAELLPVRWTLHSAVVHPYYQQIAADDGAVLHVPLPVYKRIGPQKAQLIHGAPLLGGFVARMPNYDLSGPPGLGTLFTMAPSNSQLLWAGPDEPLVGLRAYGVRHVIINWDQLEPFQYEEVAAAINEALPDLSPHYADPVLSAYRLPEIALRPFVYADTGWYPSTIRSSPIGRLRPNPRPPAARCTCYSRRASSNSRCGQPSSLSLTALMDACSAWS